MLPINSPNPRHFGITVNTFMCSNAIQAQNQTDSFEVNEFDSTTGVTWSSIKIMKLTSLCDVYLISRRIIILHQLIT